MNIMAKWDVNLQCGR